MELALSFAVFALHVLCMLSTVQGVPVSSTRGLATLPLKRIPLGDDVHPQILLQLQVNSAHRRLARLTGFAEPSDAELNDNLQRRYVIINASSSDLPFAKRFNQAGVPPPKANSNAINLGVVTSPTGQPITEPSDPTAANSIGLAIQGPDVAYFAVVQIGTPPRDFNILMDSGSADFWVGAENCASTGASSQNIKKRQTEDAQPVVNGIGSFGTLNSTLAANGQGVQSGLAPANTCGQHTFLGPQASSSFVDNGKTFSVSYGTGQVSGDVITDDVILAGLPLPAHTFGVATQESVEFTGPSTTFDGLMGLAQSTLSQQKVLTPVEALAQSGAIADAVTAYRIGRSKDSVNDGEITFGGVDSSKFDTSTFVTFQNVNQRGFWEGAMSAVQVDGQDVGLQGRTAILDTGTTLIVAPAPDAAALLAAIPGSQSDGNNGFTIPCNSASVISLVFGGRAFSIDPRDLNLGPSGLNDGQCVAGVVSGSLGGPPTQWLVGDVFLKNAYFVTDVGNNQLSLAVPV